ncbi:hypothetical protein ACQKQD_16435 [Methylobacterium sp. NPDC080182]|uniref:hypothetical protein n=1 Tax=Methylobacterium sp. NPDC080182 TaxID=3390590 RepID=UPI003D09575D
MIGYALLARCISQSAVLLALALAAAPGLAEEAKDDKAKSSSNNGSSGAKSDKSDKQKDVDTEHLFGFTEGSDTGEKGEQEVLVDTISRFSKRRDGPGRSTYHVLDTRFSYQFNPVEQFSVELSAFGNLRRQRNIADLDDKAFGTFDGASVELKYQFLKGSAEQPLGLALELRPRFTRVLPVEGNGANVFDMESLIQLDVQLVPGKVWYGSNISFEPAAGRQRGGGQGYRSSTFLWSNAVVGQVTEGTFVGPEVRYLRGYDGVFLNHLESEAVLVGPVLHRRFTEKIWLTVAYAAQVWGRDTDPTYARRGLGLTQFERHNLRVKFGMEF